jgi:hypothetical protein
MPFKQQSLRAKPFVAVLCAVIFASCGGSDDENSQAAMAATAVPAATGVITQPLSDRIQSIAAMLPAAPRGRGAPCSDKAVWANARQQPGMEDLLKDAATKMTQALPAWSDDAYLEYSRTGERTRGENMIAGRFSWLYPLTIAACVNEVMLELIANPSWTLPAHDSKLNNFYGKAYDVDLRASESASDFAQTLYMLQGQLSESTRSAVMKALEQRIFEPMRAPPLRAARGTVGSRANTTGMPSAFTG